MDRPFCFAVFFIFGDHLPIVYSSFRSISRVCWSRVRPECAVSAIDLDCSFGSSCWIAGLVGNGTQEMVGSHRRHFWNCFDLHGAIHLVQPNPGGDRCGPADRNFCDQSALESALQTMPLELKSIITCPECGFQKEEIMPENSCQYFYACTHCCARLKPKAGDCCVFCSYGSITCPPKQKNRE